MAAEPGSRLGQGFTPSRAPAPGSSVALLEGISTAAGGSISPGTPEWRRHPPCPRLAMRNRFYQGSAELQNWSGQGRAERQGASRECFPLLPLAAFTSSPPGLSHKDFNCSHGQRFGLGRHPASLSRSKTTPHTFLKV